MSNYIKYKIFEKDPDNDDLDNVYKEINGLL